MSIAEFLLARIAEDEEQANRSKADEAMNPNLRLPASWIHGVAARVLAECEAKRRIVELHSVASTYQGGTYCAECQSEELEGPWSRRDDLYPCPTLEALASVYADHPDYRDEWRI